MSLYKVCKRSLHHISLALFILFIGVNASFAEETKPTSDTFDSKWITYYYMNKDPNRLGEFLLSIEKKEVLNLDKQPNSFLPFLGFLTVIFSENPDTIADQIKMNSYTGKTKMLIKGALWLSGNGHLIKTIFNENIVLTKTKPGSILEMKIRSPNDLDVLWGAFLGSGDTKYLSKIISVLDESKPITNNQMMNLMIQQAASWSLASNIQQHDLVKTFVKSEISSQAADMKKTLETIYNISQSEKNPGPLRKAFDIMFGEKFQVLEASESFKKDLEHFDSESDKIDRMSLEEKFGKL